MSANGKRPGDNLPCINHMAEAQEIAQMTHDVVVAALYAEKGDWAKIETIVRESCQEIIDSTPVQRLDWESVNAQRVTIRASRLVADVLEDMLSQATTGRY